MSTPPVLTIHIDGAARGNPGPAAFAYVITSDGQPTVEEAGCLGSVTNNVAEYTALVRALERAATLGTGRLVIRSDSELLVKQMNGEYRVKNEQLRDLFDRAKELCAHFASVTLQHIRREQNKRADELCNLALDGRMAPAPPKHSRAATDLEDVRSDILVCLLEAAGAWADGDPKAVTPEEVRDQIWQILQDAGLLRPRRR